MKHRRVLAGVAVVAVLAAIVFAWIPRSDLPSLRANAGGAESGASAASPAAPSASRGATASRAGGRKEPAFEPVSRLSQLAQAARRSSDNRGQAIYELQWASMYCENSNLFLDHPSSGYRKQLQTPGGRRRHEQRTRSVRAFCDEAGINQDQALNALLNELPADDPYLQASMLDSETRDPVDVAIAMRLANQVGSPAALDRASEFLIERGETLPVMKSWPWPRTAQGADLRAAIQRLAVKMVTCQVRGGCGPEGLYTRLWCSGCNPGTTLEQSWQQTYPPPAIRLARAIAARLIANGSKQPN
jgi:hypothetical protein